jgi:hypothetical protein
MGRLCTRSIDVLPKDRRLFGKGLTHQDFNGLLLGHDFVRFVRSVFEVVDKAYVLAASLLDGTANRMMYKGRLDLDVDQLHRQVCPKSQGRVVINDQTNSSTSLDRSGSSG